VNLGELITALEAVDPNKTVRHGFANPHSYRGDYMDLAFEPVQDTTVRAMLDAARSAVGVTFQGWKGGDFLMDADSWCWLSPHGEASCETLSPQTVAWMLASSAGPAPATDRAAFVDRVRALTLLEAADFLRDAHFRDGLTVQEIGTALRNSADRADPMVGSLARDGFGLDEIAVMLDKPALRCMADETPQPEAEPADQAEGEA